MTDGSGTGTVIDAETRAIAKPSPTPGMIRREEWTPDQLEEAMKREIALRDVFIKYYQSQLKPNVHYYNLKGTARGKPALAKEGALNLCSLFRVTPDFDDPVERWDADGHFSVRYRSRLYDRGGAVVAVGEGSCTSREEKYAFRWVFRSALPKDIDPTVFPTRTITTKNGKVPQYQVVNANIADVYNTVLKMAQKRALVAAALALPLVSELFTQDLEEDVADSGGDDDGNGGDAKGGTKGSPPPVAAPPGSPQGATRKDTAELAMLSAQLNKNLGPKPNGLGFQADDIEILRSLSHKVTGKRSRADYDIADYRRMVEATSLMLKGQGLEAAIAAVESKYGPLPTAATPPTDVTPGPAPDTPTLFPDEPHDDLPPAPEEPDPGAHAPEPAKGDA